LLDHLQEPETRKGKRPGGKRGGRGVWKKRCGTGSSTVSLGIAERRGRGWEEKGER